MRCHKPGLGSSPVARHYWGNHCYFLFLEVLRCFSSLRLPPYTYIGITTLQVAGLSHSEIPGSKVICTYPGLIAAYHVLHRLREPRHPPCALSYFLSSHRCNTNRTGQLILSAVASPPTIKEGREHARLILVIYSLACVNMSKILCPQGAGGE